MKFSTPKHCSFPRTVGHPAPNGESSVGKRRLQANLRLCARWLWASLLPFTTGCLNPEFVNMGTGQLYPTAPGDNPFILVVVLNHTSATIDFEFFVDRGSGAERVEFIENLTPGQDTIGQLFRWPVVSVGLGDPANPIAPAITATFESGLTIQVPAGAALFGGTDFQEGDTIVFLLEEDARSSTFISLSAGVVDGSSQPGATARSQPFDTIHLLLIRSGLLFVP